MSYFLTSENLKKEIQAQLSGDEARHILLSRRMKKGDKFNLQDKNHRRYAVEIQEVGKHSLRLEVLGEIAVPAEPEAKIILFQASVNEKALDFILQKSTELGAAGITIFNSRNTAVKLSHEAFKKKRERWGKILWEAAKQSDRVRPPELGFANGLDEAISQIVLPGKIILCDIAGEKAKNFLMSPSAEMTTSIFIGPEGGFTAQEIGKIKILDNCMPLSLGPVLLRAETAALAALAIARSF